MTGRDGPLRVLHLGFEDPAMPGAGGGSLRTHEINRRLAAAGMDVTVLTTRFPGCADRVQDGVRYVHVGAGGGGSRLTRLLGYVLGLPAAVRRYGVARRADLVVEDFFAPFSSMAAPLWTRRPTIGVVQWLQAREKSRQYHLPLHLLRTVGVRSHRRVVSVSADTADQLRAIDPGLQVEVIGNGVDPALFDQPQQAGSDVVHVGRLEFTGKGLDLLLDAWQRVHATLDGQLVIAGAGHDEARVRRRWRDGAWPTACGSSAGSAARRRPGCWPGRGWSRCRRGPRRSGSWPSRRSRRRPRWSPSRSPRCARSSRTAPASRCPRSTSRGTREGSRRCARTRTSRGRWAPRPPVRRGLRPGRAGRAAGGGLPRGGGGGGGAVTVPRSPTPVGPVPEGVARVLHDGAPALFVSPHLDDAVLSCGALMRAMAARAAVTVVTVFSAATPPPHTRAARTFLRQCSTGATGATGVPGRAADAGALFAERRREDAAVLGGLGVRHVHLGHPDALFRRRRDPSGLLGWAGRALPGLEHRYPTFRLDIALGRVSRGDRQLRETITGEVADLARGTAVFAPLGVGRHVDHLLARAVGEYLGAVLYADFPHTARDPRAEGVAAGGRRPWAWAGGLAAKRPAIAGYRTQVDALFPDGEIPLRPETYYAPPSRAATSRGAGLR